MQLRLKPLQIGPFELIGAGVLAIVVVLLANSKQLLNYYGLQSSDQLIKTNAGTSVTHALRSLDSFKATNSVVTFLIWATVGIVCFGIVESIGAAYGQFKLNEQVSSKKFIHPDNFTKAAFWRGIMLDTFSLLCGFAALAIVLLAFGTLALPLSLAYSRVFLFDLSVPNVLYMLLGLAVVFIGLCLIDVAVRFLVYRRKIVSLA